MTTTPVELDEHRGMAAQQETVARRQLKGVEAERAERQALQDELEAFLMAEDAATWPEAAARARYLIQLYAATPDAQDPRYQQLISNVLLDFARLSGDAEDRDAEDGDAEDGPGGDRRS